RSPSARSPVTGRVFCHPSCVPLTQVSGIPREARRMENTSDPLRIVALEEHVSFKRFNAEIDPQAMQRRGFLGTVDNWAGPRVAALDDGDGERLRSMDESGITVQVLSVVGPGADIVPPDAAPDFARRYNDEVAR